MMYHQPRARSESTSTSPLVTTCPTQSYLAMAERHKSRVCARPEVTRPPPRSQRQSSAHVAAQASGSRRHTASAYRATSALMASSSSTFTAASFGSGQGRRRHDRARGVGQPAGDLAGRTLLEADGHDLDGERKADAHL